MTFMDCARRLAHQESCALRAWARNDMRPPRAAPVDHWGEWPRIDKHSNTTTKRKAAA